MLVSIIIPNYNRSELICDTLKSIIAQTYQNWECIVVDDYSTDNSIEVIRNYVKLDNRIKLIVRPKDRQKGANACRNYGFEVSNGEYVNWFDSDDIMHPNKIEKQLLMLQNTGANFCICKTLKFKEHIKDKISELNTRPSTSSTFDDFLIKRNIWLTQAPLFKANFLRKNKLYFDETLQASQEWEFFCRILNVDCNYSFIDEILVFLRVHAKSISTLRDSNMYWHYFLARKKIFALFQSKLSTPVKTYFYNYFVESLYIMLKRKNYNKAKLIITNINENFTLSAVIKIKLHLTYFLFRYTGKGYVLIKTLKR